MTHHLRRAINIISRALPPQSRILEIGSKQEKNQRRITNLRNLFPGVEYIGVDMRKGPGVDLVVNAEKLPFHRDSFSLTLCLETLEHAIKPWLVVSEIERVTQREGLAIISSQQNYPIHKHPEDYYRYTPYGLAGILTRFPYKLVFSISPPFDDEVKNNPQTVVVIAWKRKNNRIKKQIKTNLINNCRYISGHKPYRHRFYDSIKYIKRGMRELLYRQEIEFFNIK